MVYIFMDESGDLGFRNPTRGSSRHFVLAFFCTEDKTPFEKMIKKINATIKKYYHKGSGVFHATQENKYTIMKALKALVAEGGFSILLAYCNKENVPIGLTRNKHALYNLMVSMVLKNAVRDGIASENDKNMLVASQRETNAHLNHDFIQTIGIGFKVGIKKPHEEKCLQVADLIAWSALKKYETGNDQFYNIVKKFIVVEYEIFP